MKKKQVGSEERKKELLTTNAIFPSLSLQHKYWIGNHEEGKFYESLFFLQIFFSHTRDEKVLGEGTNERTRRERGKELDELREELGKNFR